MGLWPLTFYFTRMIEINSQMCSNSVLTNLRGKDEKSTLG